MRRLKLSLAPLLLLAIGAPACARADAPPVVLREPPALMQDAPALPRLVSGAPQAIIGRVNAAPAQIDASALRDGRDCGGPVDSYSRSVATTMRGPRFLSFFVYDNFMCPDASPTTSQQGLVFDLATGGLVNWETLLPGKVRVKKFPADLEKTVPFNVIVTSDAIWALYRKAALKDVGSDPGCASEFAEQHDLILSLDAAHNAVAADAAVERRALACEITLYLYGDALKSLGPSEDLIAALNAAHREVAPAGER